MVPQIEQVPVRVASSISVRLCFISRTGYGDQITTANTGSVKKIPDHFVVLEGGHNAKDLGATGTDVYWA
jgi:hypothetical protein